MVTFLFVLILIGIVIVLLAISILFKKNGKFPDMHIEDNQHLKKMGISCASNDEYECAYHSAKEKSACNSCTFSSCPSQNT